MATSSNDRLADAPAKAGLRRTLARSAAHFAASTLVTQGSGLLRTYVAAKLLGPSVWGIWLGVRLIVDYGSQLHLGVLYGLHRNVPLLRGRGDEGRVRAAKDSAFTLVLLMTCCGAAAVVAAGLWWHTELRATLLAVAAALAATLLKSYWLTVFKADNRFREASIAQVVGSAVGLASLGLVFVLGLPGFALGMCAQALAEGGYMAARSRLPRLRVSWPTLAELLAIGLMTVLITSAGTLLTSIDRTVILEKLSEEQLGFYGIAFIVITFLTGVAGVPNAVLYPRLSERFGETGRAADLAPMVLEPIRTLGIGFAALTGTGCLLLPPLVRLFLPKFIPGIFAAQIAMFATYPYVVVGVASSALLALNTQRTYLGIVLFASGVSYAAARGLVHFWPGLPAVAAGCGVGLFTYMVGVVGGALWVMEQPATAAVRAIASAMWPVLLIGAIALGASAGLSRLLPGHPWLAAISGAAIVLAVSAPLVLRSARQLLRG